MTIQQNLLDGITTAAAAQSALNMPALGGMDLVNQPGIVADMHRYTLPVTYTNGTTAVTLGVTLTAVVPAEKIVERKMSTVTGAYPG